MEELSESINSAAASASETVPDAVPADENHAGILAAVVLLFLAVYTLYHVLQFTLHYFDAANRNAPLPTFKHYLRGFASEWWYSLGMVFSYPVGWFPVMSVPEDPDDSPPILLVHGYAMNRMCMFAVYWRLRRLGYRNIHTMNLSPPLGTLDAMAGDFVAVLDSLSHHCGGRDVTVICHSMGGLVARRAVQTDAELPVERIITIGSPHHGSLMAVLGQGGAAKQMRPGSEFLDSLGAETRVPVRSIWTRVDSVVIPSVSSDYGNDTVVFDDVGHMAMLFSPRCFSAIVERVPDLGSRRALEPLSGNEAPDPS